MNILAFFHTRFFHNLFVYTSLCFVLIPLLPFSPALAIELKANVEGTYLYRLEAESEFVLLFFKDLVDPSLSFADKQKICDFFLETQNEEFQRCEDFHRWLSEKSALADREILTQSQVYNFRFSTSYNHPQKRVRLTPHTDIKTPLAVLLSRTADLNPLRFEVKRFSHVSQILTHEKIQPSEERLRYFQSQIQALAYYQMSDELPVRELISNGLDAYYRDPDLANLPDKPVNVVLSDHSFSVSDFGTGMSLNDVIYYLLTPDRSKQQTNTPVHLQTKRLIGQFGRGFYSILSFLNEPQDQIILKTKKPNSESVQLLFSKVNDEFQVQFSPIENSENGTLIQVHSSRLSPEKLNEVERTIRTYFQFSKRGAISINGDPIANHDLIKKQEAIQVSSEIVQNGEGKLFIIVNGVVIKALSFLGRNIFRNAVIEFPPETPLTQDRSTLNFYNQATRQFIQKSVEAALDNNHDYTLLNTLVPLLLQEGVNLFPQLSSFYNPSQAPIPSYEEIADIKKLADRTTHSHLETVIIHKKFFDDSDSFTKGLPFILQDPKIVPFQRNEGPKVRFLRNTKTPLVFLDEKIAPPEEGGILTYSILNKIYNFNNRKNTEPLISLKRVEPQFPSQSPEPLLISSPIIQGESDTEADWNSDLPHVEPEFYELAKKVVDSCAEDLKDKENLTLRLFEFGPLVNYSLARNFFKNLLLRQIIRKYPYQSSIDPSKKTFDAVKEWAEYQIHFLGIISRIYIKDVLSYDDSRIMRSLYIKEKPSPIDLEVIPEQINKALDNDFYGDGVESLGDRLEYSIQGKNIFQFELTPELNEIFEKEFSDFAPQFRNEFQKRQKIPETVKLIDLQRYVERPENQTFQEIISFILSQIQYKNGNLIINYLEKSQYGWYGDFTREKILKILTEFNSEIVTFHNALSKVSDLEQNDLIKTLVKLTKYLSNHQDIKEIKSKSIEFLPKYLSECKDQHINNCLDLLVNNTGNLNLILYLHDKPESHFQENLKIRLRLYFYFLGQSQFETRINSRIDDNRITHLDDFYMLFLNKLLRSEIDLNYISKHVFFLRYYSLWLYTYLHVGLNSDAREIIEKNATLWVEEFLSEAAKGEVSPETVDRLISNFEVKNSKKNLLSEVKKVYDNSLDKSYAYYLTKCHTDEMSSVLFLTIYGDSIKFLPSQDFLSDSALSGQSELRQNLNKGIPLASHHKIRHIKGSDLEINRKLIAAAVGQNPNSSVWIREAIKNSKEAGATQFAIEVRKDLKELLTVTLTDNGPGVIEQDLYKFFIPGVSSKLKSSDDINFGWGFFTLLNYFDQVVIESFAKGSSKRSFVQLFKHDNEIYVSDIISLPTLDSELPGIRLHLRKYENPNGLLPSQLKSSVIQYSPMDSNFQISFNGETILNPNLTAQLNPLLSRPLKINHQSSNVKIEVFQTPFGGLYYNGSRISDLREYEDLLTDQEKDIFDFYPVALHLKGELAMNAGRTRFRDHEQFKNQLVSALREGRLRAKALEVLKDPDVLFGKAFVPYDFFTEFRPDQDELSHVQDIRTLSQQVLKNGDWYFDLLLKNSHLDEIWRYFVNLPIISVTTHSRERFEWGNSLFDLKVRIKHLFEANGLLNEAGRFVTESEKTESDKSDLKQKVFQILHNEFQEKSLQPFICQIISKVTSEFGKILESGETEDFSVRNQDSIPAQFKEDGPALRAMEQFILQEVNHFIPSNRNLSYSLEEVQFFSSPDPVLAHALPSLNPHTIAINISLDQGIFKKFQTLLKNGKFDRDIYVDIIETVTHEMTHLREGSEETEGTHNSDFFVKQQELIENFLSFGVEDVQRVERFLNSRLSGSID